MVLLSLSYLNLPIPILFPLHHLCSAFSFLVSRFSFLVSRFSFLGSHFSFLGSRFSVYAAYRLLLIRLLEVIRSRFCNAASRLDTDEGGDERLATE